VRKVHKLGLLMTALSLAAAAQSLKPTLEQANAALQAGEADNALSVLNSLPESAESHNLRCRVLYALRNWDQAVSECQQAVRMDGQSSDNHLWLGRALGEKADRATFLSAYSLGKQVKAEFEESVRLNPRNAEALADLGEFYTEAPGVVGGGTAKAAGVAAQLDKVDPARAHELRARIAEANKDYATAEQEFRKAISVSEHPAFQWMALASFFRRRERWSELQEAVQNGFKAAQRDRHSGAAIYDGASILSRDNRDLALAAKMMEVYLAGSSKTEEAPAFEAHTRLARMKAKLGDVPGAWQERALALQLAHDYRPALELKF
jgi:tetratricopeptide (TPR) repeat protein